MNPAVPGILLISGALITGDARAADDVARSWETLHDARLVEAADGTPSVAAAYYTELLDNMAPGDPLYGPTCYWLGRARFGLGDLEGAVEALREAARDPATQPAADGLLSRLEMEARRVRAFPASMGFERGVGAFVRAGAAPGAGPLATVAVDGDAVLSWATAIQPGGTDRVGLAFDPGTLLEHVSFRVRAVTARAHLVVSVSDGAGAFSRAPGIDLPIGEWMTVDLPISSFLPARGKSARAVRVLEIEDRTGLAAKEAGQNTILFDDVELR